MPLIDKRTIFNIVFLYLCLNGLLLGLYYSPAHPVLTKDLWEVLSLSFHVTAMVICWVKYSRSKTAFLLWCSLCISALAFRDWHIVRMVEHPTLTSIFYYTILVLAFGSGILKRDKIKEVLQKNKILILLWGCTFLFYFSSYLYDREMISHFGASEGLLDYEGYIEEASEATGAFLLLITAVIFRK